MNRAWPALITPLILLAACSFEPGEFAGRGGVVKDQGELPAQGDVGVDMWGGGARDMRAVGVKDAEVQGGMTPSPGDMKGGVDASVPQDMRPASKDMAGSKQDMGVFRQCDGERVDILSDPAHCGGCGTRCDASFGACVGGVCGCVASGLQTCGNANRCEDVLQDPNHCGGCGRTCDASSVCQGGACVCRPEYTECGGKCVNLKENPGHCGECDKVCEDREACDNGECAGWLCAFKKGCSHPDGGRTCLSAGNDGDNPDFCINALGCGQTCEGAEVCAKEPGSFSSRRVCRDSRVGRGCGSCPCADCAMAEFCLPTDTPSLVWCVKS